MTDDRDPVLESLFSETRYVPDGQEFTASVVSETRKFRYKIMAGLILVALLILASAWLLELPIQEIVQLIMRGLATNLVELGEGWAAWVLAPVNNVASLLVLSVKIIRVLMKKIINASYSN